MHILGTLSGFYGYVVFLELDQDTALTSEETSKVSSTHQSFMRRLKGGGGRQVDLNSPPINHKAIGFPGLS